MPASARARILCVDDEPRILDVFALFLREKFDVAVATSGHEGLSALQKHGPFAVVLSDMRMPGMSGTTFLSQVRQLAPDTVRLLLSGDADDAVADSDDADVFTCLEKPCPFDRLVATVEQAAEQYRLNTQNREQVAEYANFAKSV